MSDISPLSGAAGLEFVDLRGTKVTCLEPLAGARSLREMFVDRHENVKLEQLARNRGLSINGRSWTEWAKRYIRDVVFVSYARSDKKWLESIEAMLQPVLRAERVAVWHDGHIKPSQQWREEIRGALERARVDVLLVSHKFLASNFIMEEELPYLLGMARKASVRILWVPISHCMFEQTELREIQAVFEPRAPLDSRRGANRDYQLKKVCEAIVRAYEETPDLLCEDL